MGSDNFSNQKRSVATTGTEHFARTKSYTDVCYVQTDPSKKDCFDNFVPTTQLKKGATDKTIAADEKIWTEVGEVGPMSDPLHPPFDMGDKSGQPYRKEAVATSFSADVIAEGHGVVRTNDDTEQNAKNTTGYVDGAMLGEGFDSQLDFMKKKCTIVDLEGSEGDRALGFPRGEEGEEHEAYYIEVLSGDSVELRVKRTDMTKPGEDAKPDCRVAPGSHTTWSVVKKHGNDAGEPEVTEGQDEIEISSGLLGKFAQFTSGGGDGLPTGDGVEAGGGGLGSLAAAIQYWRYDKFPYVITANAIACAGNRTATIKVFPKNKINLSLAVGESESGSVAPKRLQPFIKALGKLRSVIECAERFGKLAGQRLTPSPEFLVGCTVTFECAFEKITEDKFGQRQEHVGLAWSLTFSAGPLLSFTVAWRFSLITLCAGCIGKAAAWVLEKLGVECNVVVKASVAVTVDISLGIDAYGRATKTGSSVPVTLKLGLALELKAVKYALRGGLDAVCSLRIGIYLADDDKHLLALKFSGKLYPELYLEVVETSSNDIKWDKRVAMEEWGVSFEPKPLNMISMS